MVHGRGGWCIGGIVYGMRMMHEMSSVWVRDGAWEGYRTVHHSNGGMHYMWRIVTTMFFASPLTCNYNVMMHQYGCYGWKEGLSFVSTKNIMQGV